MPSPLFPPQRTPQEEAEFYRQQIEKLGDFILQNYDKEITGEMGLEPTAVEIAIRLLSHGKTTDGILSRLHQKNW